MSETINSDYLLNKYADEVAADIFEEFKRKHGADFDPEDYRDEMFESAWESVDGCEHVIYNYRALQICANCNTNDGESRAEDMGGYEGKSFYEIACMIAFCEILCRVETELDSLIEDYDPEESDEEE